MNISIPELGFTEYAILALIQTILLCLSAFEYSSAKGRWSLSAKEQVGALKRAGTWAFVGILVTLSLGISAQVLQNGVIELPLTLIPIIFISLWANYYRRGSQVVELKLIQDEADEYYLELIVRVIDTNAQQKRFMDIKDLYIQCVSKLEKEPNQWMGMTSLLKGNRLLLSTSGVGSLLEAFWLSYERYEVLLGRLELASRIQRDSDGLYHLPSGK